MALFFCSRFFLPLYFFFFQTLEVGFIDALEFKYVNPPVFYQHNFPDILGISHDQVYNRGVADAFISGLKCCPPLLIPCAIKMLVLYRSTQVSSKQLCKFHGWLALGMLAADLWVLYTFDPKHHDMYRNHRCWYRLHGGVEVISLLSCLFL